MPTRRRIARALTLLLCLVLLFASILPIFPVALAQDGEPAHPATADVSAQIGSITGSVTHNGAGLGDVTITATLVEAAGKPQIILLPGVLGTELTNNTANPLCVPSGKLWLDWDDLDKLLSLQPLYLNDSGNGPRNSACVISPSGPTKLFLMADPYGPFVSTARNAQFDVLEYPGYDWRLDVLTSAQALDSWINVNADLSRPIYLVGHSMGGLVARAYVADKNRADKIAGVVTVGTPYLGAPVLVQQLIDGKTGKEVDWLILRSQLKEIMRYSPGIQMLMPSAGWFIGSTPTYLIMDGTPRETYAATVGSLVSTSHIHQDIVNMATAFHSDFDGFNSNFHAKFRYTALYSGTHETTPRTLVCRANGCIRIRDTTDGDGTVPVRSAALTQLEADARAGVTFCGYNANVAEHGDLLRDTRVIQDVLHVLAGNFGQCPPGVSSSDAAADATGAETFREVTVRAAGRVRVVDGGGIYTGVGDDDIIRFDLPDVTFHLMTGGVFITLPLNADYRIEIEQEGSDAMQVLASDFGPSDTPNEFAPQAQATFNNVTFVDGSAVTLPNAGAPLASLTLTVDANNDDTPEQTLTPDAVLTTPEQAQDYVPPTSTIAIDGAKNAEGKYEGPVTVTLAAQDNAGGSGVLATRYSLDDGATWQKYAAPFSVQPGAALAVRAFSTDRAGNQEYPYVEQPLEFAGASRIWLPTVGRGGGSQVAAQEELTASAPTPATPPVAVQGPLPAPALPAHAAALDTAAYTATTNAQGYYTLGSLPVGTYTVTAQLAGYSLLPLSRQVSVTAGQSVPNIDFTATAFTPGETVLIPAGGFTMGCDAAVDPWGCIYHGGAPETPYHTVILSAYRIDKYEVTNARYQECVAAGNCTAPQSTQANRCDANGTNCGYSVYYGVPAYANYPVVNVTWYQADAYCRATGGRLPTEAEWERAARGSADRRVWPWGNTLACSNANVDSDHQAISCGDYGLEAVGSYPTGASPEGVMDMSGNAWEWVQDWGDRVYTEVPATNPQGPASGSHRVLRGGSFDRYSRYARVSDRFGSYPVDWNSTFGFRCVRSP